MALTIMIKHWTCPAVNKIKQSDLPTCVKFGVKSGSGSASNGKPNPDRYQNNGDPQHWFYSQGIRPFTNNEGQVSKLGYERYRICLAFHLKWSFAIY